MTVFELARMARERGPVAIRAAQEKQDRIRAHGVEFEFTARKPETSGGLESCIGAVRICDGLEPFRKMFVLLRTPEGWVATQPGFRWASAHHPTELAATQELFDAFRDAWDAALLLIKAERQEGV